jgi:hypothetical protein
MTIKHKGHQHHQPLEQESQAFNSGVILGKRHENGKSSVRGLALVRYHTWYLLGSSSTPDLIAPDLLAGQSGNQVPPYVATCEDALQKQVHSCPRSCSLELLQCIAIRLHPRPYAQSAESHARCMMDRPKIGLMSMYMPFDSDLEAHTQAS